MESDALKPLRLSGGWDEANRTYRARGFRVWVLGSRLQALGVRVEKLGLKV